MKKKKYNDIMNEYYLLEHVVQLIHYYLNNENDLFQMMDVYEKLHDELDYYLLLNAKGSKKELFFCCQYDLKHTRTERASLVR
jgi:hypothetical protein